MKLETRSIPRLGKADTMAGTSIATMKNDSKIEDDFIRYLDASLSDLSAQPAFLGG
jgi:hypothetical protein